MLTFSGSGEDHEKADGEPMEIKSPKSSSKFPQSPTKMMAKKKSRSTSSVGAQKTQTRVHQSGIRVLYTAGRPPWYNTHGELKEAFVIGDYTNLVSSVFYFR